MGKKVVFSSLINFFIKKIYILIISICIFSFIGFLWSKYTYKPVYSNESSFVVYHKNAKAKETDLSAIATYQKVLKNRIILSEVQSEMKNVKGYSGSVKALANDIKTTNDPGTLVITVSGEGKTPRIATKLANITIGVFKEKANTLLSAGTVKQLAKAQSKYATKSPQNKKKFILLGAFVGFAVGILTMLIIGRRKFIK